MQQPQPTQPQISPEVIANLTQEQITSVLNVNEVEVISLSLVSTHAVQHLSVSVTQYLSR